jgi:hypothetical protein
VQVRFATTSTSDQYVTEQAWRAATLERCPVHPEGGCGLAGHGSYGRVRPAQIRVARFWCPKARVTISLLPDFLASRLSGTLAEVEEVADAAEAAESREAAVEVVRPAAAVDAVTLPSALRWLRRRLVAVHAALVAAVTLVPALAECRPTLGAMRERLGVSGVLVALRSVAAPHLVAMPTPVGFRARGRARRAPREPTPHETGPDPPRRGR